MDEHRVVVGVDESEPARRALAWALDEARLRAATLEVVIAWEPPPQSTAQVFVALPLQQFEAAANATIAAMVRSVAGDAGSVGVEVIPSVVMAPSGGALLDAARGADLLVVGSRGRGRIKSLVLGSVSQQCATHAHGVIAVIPPRPGHPALADGDNGGNEKMEAPARLIVGIDGSAGSNAALRWAVDDARRRATSVVAILAYSYLDQYGPLGSINFEPDYGQSDADLAAKTIVAKVLGDDPPVDVEARAVCDLPAAALHGCAGPHDIVVVGARGRGGFAGLLLGSVSLQTLRDAACPVVVVHLPKDGG